MVFRDAVILGKPVHMGSIDYRVKAFVDRVENHLRMQEQMEGKAGAPLSHASLTAARKGNHLFGKRLMASGMAV